MTQLEKRVILMLSTAHMKPETAAVLSATDPRLWPVAGWPTPYGYQLMTPDGEPIDELYADLSEVVRFATARGFDRVEFDRDGPTIPDLPTWDW